eukprot:scaffold18978_cov74-Cyclotella_meneghiniana.AAC.8
MIDRENSDVTYDVMPAIYRSFLVEAFGKGYPLALMPRLCRRGAPYLFYYYYLTSKWQKFNKTKNPVELLPLKQLTCSSRFGISTSSSVVIPTVVGSKCRRKYADEAIGLLLLIVGFGCYRLYIGLIGRASAVEDDRSIVDAICFVVFDVRRQRGGGRRSRRGAKSTTD